MVSASIFQSLITPFLYAALATFGSFISIWGTGDRVQDLVQLKFEKGNGQHEFDFIVVGAGSAGSVVAHRLSQEFSVLLLEAGGEPNPLQMVPGFALFFVNYPETDWMFRTVTQTRGSLHSVNGECSWSAGLGLGGTGNLNGLTHLRGHYKDYDNWGRRLNDPNWSYEGVLPFFKKSETFKGDTNDPETRGFDGPMQVEAPDYIGLGPEWNAGARELGYPNIDLNGRFNQGGFDISTYPLKNGVRQAPFEAFIQTARNRNSLMIRKYSSVHKILLRDDNSAYGVVYDRHGTNNLKAYAKKEVIISAGAVMTSKILMLSGIGPREHLSQLGIPVRADLPVGQNLQDHLAAYLGPFIIDQPRTIFLERDVTKQAVIGWGKGKGVLTSSGTQATSLFSSSYAKARGEGDWPDIQFFLVGIGGHKTFPENVAHAYNLRRDVLEKYYANVLGRDFFHIPVSTGRPLARGEIRLGGPNPKDKLIIDPKYFSDPFDNDLKITVDGIKVALALAENTTAFRNLGSRFTNDVLPGCENVPFRSDDYWACYAQKYSVTLHHYCGTAAIGTVVDSNLRVKGIRNLRVADASVMPVISVSNTQAPAMMIGEKGAHMILEYWSSQSQTYGNTIEHFYPYPSSQNYTNTLY